MRSPSSRSYALSLLSLSLCLAGGAPAFAQETEPEPEEVCEPQAFRDALTGGRTWARLRYRLETVDQDPFAQDATANTLRTVLGYETAPYHGFKGLIEFEDVAPLGNDMTFNSTTNGATTRPVVADPDGTEINQVYGSYDWDGRLRARVGRQEIAYGNHRFVGNVPWRQNFQSFDAGRLTYTGIPETTVDYAFLHGVNRIFGENHPAGRERMRGHLLDIRHELDGIGDLAAYALLLDFDRTLAANTRTVGLRLSGKRPLDDEIDLHYTAEYADQQDSGKNPTAGGIDTEYWLAELGIEALGAKLLLGNEHLGSSGSAGPGFSTPLATLHKFNGFADLFLATPSAGLEDRYLTLSRTFAGVRCAATYHQFDADAGSMDYGRELDLVASYPVTERLGVHAKYANFNRDGAAPAGFQDTEKLMFWITYDLL